MIFPKGISYIYLMILVTGGTGLVGSHLLLDLIRSGEKVRAIHRKNSNLKAVRKVFSYEHPEEEAGHLFNKIEWIESDITDIPSLDKAFKHVKKVYHCAAVVSFDSSASLKLRKTNIEGTANVVNFCIKNKVEKLCYVSSIATFDKKLGEGMVSESSGWNKEIDHSMYAITKYGAEMEVWRASQEGVPVIIVNPGVIIGSGFWDSGSGVIFKKIREGLKFHFPKVTGFVGVNDVVRAMIQLMCSPVQNQQFILVSENLSFRRIFEMTAETLNKPRPNRELKPWMVTIGWVSQKTLSIFSRKERRLTKQSRKNLFEESFYSSEKIHEELNFQFDPMDKVIKRTGESFKKDFRE